MKDSHIQVPILADVIAEGKEIDVLFWVGCAGSFDARAQKVSRAFVTILDHIGINYAILGDEENCTGDPARRAGNEFVFQMMAIQNIETLKMYNVKNIVTTCPHCFNTLKNEYPSFGGNYEVLHHSEYLQHLINNGHITMEEGGVFNGKRITYHDSCFLGRANGVYNAPRKVLESLDNELVEMKRCKSNGLCCGAGGAQMFKEDEEGTHRINEERMKDIEETNAEVVAANCPFCITMLQDGIKSKDKQDSIMVYDLSELIVANNNW